MSRRILVPVDDSEQSTKALDHVLEVHPDSTVVLLHVVDPRNWIMMNDDIGDVAYSEQLETSTKEEADRLLAEMRDRAESGGVEVETVRLVGRPMREILDYLDEGEIDQIVMGSHGRTGIDRLLLGSVAETVTRRSSVPVTIVH